MYVLGVVVAGWLGFSLALAAASPPGDGDLPVALVLLAIATAAQLFPLHLSVKVKVTAEDAATFAGALLLGPALAMIVAAGSTFLGLRFRNSSMRWYNRAFNTSKSALSAGAAAAVYLALGGGPPTLDQPIPILAAAVTQYAFDSALVALAVDLQLKRRFLASWWGMQPRELPQYASLYFIGALAATMGHDRPWVFVLFSLPAALVFLTTRESARIREQTRAVILELADMIDLRDPYTHGHSQRVAVLAERLARRLRLEDAQVELVRDAARVHDIGKIGTNDLVLLKPGKLTDDERREMERHTEMGHRLLRRLPQFWEGAELVLAHHERVDGRGYPRGLRGDEVPLEASVIAVADAYDAMMTNRPYRRALAWDVVRSELLRECGRQWHTRPVEAFVAMIEEDRAAYAGPAATAADGAAAPARRSA